MHIIICTNNNKKIISSNYGRLEDLILPSKVPKGTRKCSSKLFNNLGTGPQRFSSPGPGQPFNQETASILLRRHLFLPVGTPEGISAAGLKDVEAEDVGEKEYKMFQQRTIDVKESATDSCGERWFSNWWLMIQTMEVHSAGCLQDEHCETGNQCDKCECLKIDLWAPCACQVTGCLI